jgi:uncharacterized protein YkwD
MSWIRRFAVLAAVVGCSLALVSTTALAGSFERKLIHKINTVRAASGLHALRRSRSLNRSSRSYARMMLARHYFGHLSRIRMSRRFHRRGEVLAQTRGRVPQPGTAVSQWMASPMHRAVLLDGGFRYIGVGRAYGSFGGGAATGWVAQFGS